MFDPVKADSSDPTIPAVLGEQSGEDGTAILGIGQGIGVFGQSKGNNGFSGVHGESNGGAGVSGSSRGSVGVDARTETGPAAVRAISAGNGPGVFGSSLHNGVFGQSKGSEGFSGVHGESDGGPGVSGSSTSSVGVDARTISGPAALRATHTGGGLAGLFAGDIEVTGDIRLTNADCAENFDVAGTAAVPGTVMVLNEHGILEASTRAYDTRVAGVVSGAGEYRPGIILDKRETGMPRSPIALLGKVFCKVDASYGPIAVGDLLTTSSTPGHAMVTSDPLKAFGAVIGKALGSIAAGRGMIPILVALR